MTFLTPAVRQSVPFMCFFVGSVALTINLAQLQKLKQDIQLLETKNSETLKQCHELELEKLKLETKLETQKKTWL
ncbi:hypothetical protein HDV02_006285 [Globomyces sp. JEL0801]|nr:hypothetical protein HDV02_006285 [Globomyces sp. JEL0801]